MSTGKSSNKGFKLSTVVNKLVLMTISDERRGLRDRGKSKDRSTKKITGKVRMIDKLFLSEFLTLLHKSQVF